MIPLATLALYLITISVIYSVLSFNYFFITGTSLLIDLPTRVEVNDAWVNLLYFFWTSATYLPIFFFSVGGVILFSYTSKPTSFIWGLGLILFCLYSTEWGDFLALNMNPFTLDITHTEINLLLTNSLNKYHPGLFFVSVIWFFSSLNLQVRNIHYFPTFYSNHVVTVLPKYSLALTFFNMIALVLGSWWAFQEGTWGGWWNWDASEVLGLIIGVFGLYMFHHSLTWSTIQVTFIQVNLFSLVFLLSYFFTQLNFELISHNFAPIFLLFFTKNTFFLEVESLLLSLFYFQIRSLYYSHLALIFWSTSSLITTSTSKGRTLQIITIWSIIWGGLALSFGPLLNHFLWTYFNLNSLGYILHVSLMIYLFLFGILLSFTTQTRYIGSLILFLYSTQWYALILILPLLLTPQWGKVVWIHVYLVLFLVINVLSYTTAFVEWYPWLRVRDAYYLNQLLALVQTNYTCQNTIVEVVDFYSWQYRTVQVMWNAWYGSNSFSVHAFSLLLTPGGCSNLYNVSWGWWSLFLVIETNLVHTLLDLFFFLIITIASLIIRRYVSYLPL